MKTIGIVGYRIGENGFGAGATYLEWLSQYGNVRIIMPWEKFVQVDLLVLAGGLDVNPGSYGEVPRYRTTDTDVFKQYFMDNRLSDYVIARTPIFGICLGFQQLAVYFGSKLAQNLPFHAQSPGRWQEAHKVYRTGKSYELDDVDIYVHEEDGTLPDQPPKVNSHHHQGVTASGLYDRDLECTYHADNEQDAEDPIVEAFRHRTMPICAVQWHPEELYDEVSDRMVRELVA